MALLLNSPRVRGTAGFRVLFFLPYVVPFVAGILIWQGMLNPETGWVNGFLRAIGDPDPPDWLIDPTWIYPGLVFIGIWGIGGGHHHQPRRAARHPDRAVRRGPHRRRRARGRRSAT